LADRDQVTWRDILYEEVLEAYVETDWSALRAELVQVAAVAVAWIEHLDRRGPGWMRHPKTAKRLDQMKRGFVPPDSDKSQGGV